MNLNFKTEKKQTKQEPIKKWKQETKFTEGSLIKKEKNNINTINVKVEERI